MKFTNHAYTALPQKQKLMIRQGVSQLYFYIN